jgi:hypothetical protein
MEKILKEIPNLCDIKGVSYCEDKRYQHEKELQRAVIVSMSHGLRDSEGNLSYLILLELLIERTNFIHNTSFEWNIWF